MLRRCISDPHPPQDAKLLDAENPSAAAASKTPKETAEAYEERMRRTAEEKADFLARQAEYRLNTMQPHERCLPALSRSPSAIHPFLYYLLIRLARSYSIALPESLLFLLTHPLPPTLSAHGPGPFHPPSHAESRPASSVVLQPRPPSCDNVAVSR